MKSERQEPRIALTCAGVGCCACAASSVNADMTRTAPVARPKISHNTLMPKTSFHPSVAGPENDMSPPWTAFSGAARPDKPDSI